MIPITDFIPTGVKNKPEKHLDKQILVTDLSDDSYFYKVYLDTKAVLLIDLVSNETYTFTFKNTEEMYEILNCLKYQMSRNDLDAVHYYFTQKGEN